MKYQIYSVAGARLGTCEMDGMQLAQGAIVTQEFSGHPYSRWEVLAVSRRFDGSLYAIVTPYRSRSQDAQSASGRAGSGPA